MTIDRRTIFIEAWKSARRMRGQYDTLRASFAAALRRVWGLVKAMATEAARRPTTSRSKQGASLSRCHHVFGTDHGVGGQAARRSDIDIKHNVHGHCENNEVADDAHLFSQSCV